MSDKPKRLCKWKKSDYKDRLDELRQLVNDAKYVCKRCGRAANDKKALCDPAKIED
jgi:rubrerythrin